MGGVLVPDAAQHWSTRGLARRPLRCWPEGARLHVGRAGARARRCSTSTAPTRAPGCAPRRSSPAIRARRSAGFDQELARLGRLAAEHDVVLRPGGQRGARRDRRVGLAARRHAARARATTACSASGTARRPASTARPTRSATATTSAPTRAAACSRSCGDDPACKSSTIPARPSRCWPRCTSRCFAPGSVQEALDLGRHAIACSRASGLWAALKVVTNVADATATVEVGLDRVDPGRARARVGGRAVRPPPVGAPARAAVAGDGAHARRGAARAGQALRARSTASTASCTTRPARGSGSSPPAPTAHDLRRALDDLGARRRARAAAAAAGRHALPARRARRCATSPPASTRCSWSRRRGRSSSGSSRTRSTAAPRPPLVSGERDERGAPLAAGRRRARRRRDRARGRRRGSLPRDELPRRRARGSTQLDARRRAPAGRLGAAPHAVLLLRLPAQQLAPRRPDDAIVGAGIGCHTMVMLSAERATARVTGITQMGGEGVQWIGAAPFVDVAALHPEPRRRHVPPLRLARDPRGRRGRT